MVTHDTSVAERFAQNLADSEALMERVRRRAHAKFLRNAATEDELIRRGWELWESEVVRMNDVVAKWRRHLPWAYTG